VSWRLGHGRKSALASRARQEAAVVAPVPAEASEGRASRLQLRQLARSCDDIIQDVALYKKLKVLQHTDLITGLQNDQRVCVAGRDASTTPS